MRRKIANPKPRIKRVNKSCAYFPCHKGLEDCTFCYCPFYPCRNPKLGKNIFIQNKNLHIWSCQDCAWIHKKSIVDNILKPIRNGNMAPYNQKMKTENTAIIILGHGSKVKKANTALLRIIRDIKSKGGLKIIEPSYLQLHDPNIQATVKKIVEKGCKKIVIVPFFLFMGNHVLRDIPNEIKRQAQLYKDVEFIYAKNIGQDKRISDIVLDCIKEAL